MEQRYYCETCKKEQSDPEASILLYDEQLDEFYCWKDHYFPYQLVKDCFDEVPEGE